MLLDGVTDWRELQRQYNTTTLKFIFNSLRTDPKHCNNEAPIGSRLIPEELLRMLYGWKQRLKRQKYKFDVAKTIFFSFFCILLFVVSITQQQCYASVPLLHH
jgi:hypothetical protein